LGIPGSATTAVILGALMVHGLRPGPYLFAEQPQLLYSIFIAMLVANIMFLGLGLAGAKVFARVTLIPRTFLWPAVFSLAVVGSFALAQSMLDVWIMLIFALLGFIFRRYGFSPAPIIMGLILGELVENSLKQSFLIFDHNLLLFFQRPIVVTFFVLTLAGLFGPAIFARLMRKFGKVPPAALNE
ncbi:MAG: tripartite tricarboxylate transporter permease, partial [Hyphomicrobiales bacterium]|nr:tripartite tricarboxylate transporter permease [Hyphomicrobiales bacterium]